ncbi:MAG: response regulator [Leptospira sp.]|jgi:two-component system, sporulation sensor kinase A|nr:response regulator [Leptospira sp.]NCS93398.1 response regulator [Leptospira sp.]
MKYKILVIDDEEPIRDALQRVLSREGYDVLLAENGKKGIETIERESSIQVIISDILMKDLSGIDLIQWANKNKIDIPIILITGNPSLDSAGEAIRFKAFDYIAKPVERNRILEVLKKAISQTKINEENKNNLINSKKKEFELIKKNWDLNKQNEAILSATTDCVITINSNCIIISANNATYTTFGFKDIELIGQSITCLIPKDKKKFYNRVVKSYIHGKIKTNRSQISDVLLTNSNGKIFDCDLSFCTYKIDEKIFHTGIIRDISYKKKLIQKLIDSERRAFLTTIASSIGHEINNSLTAIMGFVDLAIQPTALAPIKDKAIHVTMTQVQKLKNLTANLLTLGKQKYNEDDPSKILITNINNCIEDILDIFQKSMRLKNCTLNLQKYEKDLFVFGDNEKIGLALSNILLNAADATENRGNIFIKTYISGTDPIMEIQDDGTGMEQETLVNLYEPYFTTKGLGKGTGLGMFVVREIAELYHIEINVESKKDYGTKFILKFSPARNK